MGLGGVFLRFGAVGLRILQFCCAAIVLGIYSYFLAVLAQHNINIPTWEKAVEGMSGAATLYTIFGILFTLCLGGKAFFGFLAVILDILFVAVFAAIAYYTRHGADSCNGIVNTPLGTAPHRQSAPGAGNYGYVCHLNSAAFAVSIVNIILFLVSALWQVMLVRRARKEKRYGPSPANNYTSGSGRRPFWRRNKLPRGTRDAEMATAGTVHGHGTNRHSGETHLTGSTVDPGYAAAPDPKYGQPGYGNAHYGRNY